MTNWLLVAAILATAVAGSAAGVSPVRSFATRFGLLDQPGPRRVKTSPVPRIGGLAIYFGFLLAIGVKRANSTGAFVGIIVGMATIVYVATFTNVAFLWHNLIGAVVVVSVGIVVSALTGGSGRDRSGTAGARQEG